VLHIPFTFEAKRTQESIGGKILPSIISQSIQNPRQEKPVTADISSSKDCQSQNDNI